MYQRNWSTKLKPILVDKTVAHISSSDCVDLFCPKCAAKFNIKVSNLLRNKGNYFGWCRKCRQNTPEVLAALSETRKKQVRKPVSEETKKKQSESKKKLWDTEKFSHKMLQGMKLYWSKQENREQRKAVLKDRQKEMQRKASNTFKTSEYRKRKSKISKKSWTLERKIAAKEAWTQERKLEHIKNLKSVWTDDKKKELSNKLNILRKPLRGLRINREAATKTLHKRLCYLGYDTEACKHIVKCSECEKQMLRASIKFSQDCGSCYKKHVYRTQQSIADWIASFGFNPKTIRLKTGEFYKNNGRLVEKNIEIDIFIPEKNIGIEFCGLFWHSHQKLKNENYHTRKIEIARQNDIQLITIFENDWVIKRNQIENYIKDMLGVKTKIDSDMCAIQHVSKEEFLIFAKANDIIEASGDLVLGLRYESKLVGIVSIINEIDGKAKLNNMSFDTNIQVIGGFKKILNHLLSTFKNLYVIRDSCFPLNFKDLGLTLEYNLEPKQHEFKRGRQTLFFYDCGYEMWSLY